jgi:hypothetical protein
MKYNYFKHLKMEKLIKPLSILRRACFQAAERVGARSAERKVK